jgi:predicted nucleotidyltransferase
MIKIENETALENVPSECQDLFPKIIEAYKNQFSNNILEIRLLGSVPRGDLIEDVSDIDFLCILRGNTKCKKPQIFSDIESELQCYFPLVQKFDLDVTNENYIEQNFDYKLLIMTDSIAIYGSNLYWVDSYEIPADKLASLWNPDSNELMKKYSEWIFTAENNEVISNTTKLIGKDLLKSYRPMMMRKCNCFARSIKKTAEQLTQIFPEYSELFDILFRLYSDPISRKNIKEKIKRIEFLNQRFLAEFET